MASTSVTIPKEPQLEPNQDFALLRRLGIGYIEEMSRARWTDYNSHDPGITLLEALCYAITDLGYRTGWEIADILADPPEDPGDKAPQPFYTAKEILTVNPLTTDDFRRLIIDCARVSNAWVSRRSCACGSTYHIDCKGDRLTFMPPDGQEQQDSFTPSGTWDVMVQFDEDPEFGDLNDRKVRHTFSVERNGRNFPVTVEFRFPEWNRAAWNPASNYAGDDGAMSKKVRRFTLKNLVRTGRQLFLAHAEISFSDAGTGPIVIESLPLRISASGDDLKEFPTAWDFGIFDKRELVSGAAEPFIRKAALIERTLDDISAMLRRHRNLCEEFCCLKPVRVEEVAACADIEVQPDADIEKVLAEALFRIERYLNPPIVFSSLHELLRQGVPVEQIFEGPVLLHGFIRQEALDAGVLRRQLRTSDIINELVDIKGVVAVRNFRLTRYDDSGRPVAGVSDTASGGDPSRLSAAWTLDIDENCLPVLSFDNSSFIFYKNGLPFDAVVSEVTDTLSQFRGRYERGKIDESTECDLPVPTGRYRTPGRYSPVQNSLPLIYGTGFEGVRESAPVARHAQSKQLKGYLMVFEQLLANSFAQLDGARRLLSLDPKLGATTFVQDLRTGGVVSGIEELVSPSLDADSLHRLAETGPAMLERRNRFLDHLLARFGERFAEYALKLTDFAGGRTAPEQLIADKLAFLKACPVVSRDRALGVDYRNDRKDEGHQATLQKRIALVLGLNPSDEEKIIVVEHLLLRPRFPGDALMEVCLGKGCPPCGETDPYSFQLTVVMPSMAEHFNDDIELRRFADRTIREEIPAHLLGKICWAGNLEYGESLSSQLLATLTSFLSNRGKSADDSPTGPATAAACAVSIAEAASAQFTGWMESRAFVGLEDPELRKKLDELFRSGMASFSATCTEIANIDSLAQELYDILARHFDAAVKADDWHVYDRFAAAWRTWLGAVSGVPDTSCVCGDFVSRLTPAVQQAFGGKSDAGTIAKAAVERFAALFSERMREISDSDGSVSAPEALVEKLFDDTAKHAPLNSPALTSGERTELKRQFVSLYVPRIDQSLKLWKVVTQLRRLRSVYPPATLHDCRDGNDQNPVRLDATVLGV